MTNSTTSKDFKSHGFLAPDIKSTTDSIRKENTELFSLLLDMNSTFQKILIKGTEKHHKSTMNVKVIATFAAIRSAENFQAAIMMIERGMITQARIMARCLYENAFCIGALAENPERFLSLLKGDNIAAKRGQAKALKDGSQTLTSDLQIIIEKHLSGEKGRHLMWNEIAEMSSLKRDYVFYKLLSDDAMHLSASSLNRYMVTNPDGKTWQGYNFGPGTNSEILESAKLCASPMIAIIIGYLQATDDPSFDSKVRALINRYEDLKSL
ncbi:DUF5677 domain-containing protein [Pseudomonas japonica]|uniref:DUF5677 domain-containing protein n=1 Tax=Pseudomonas japonica TaxID=256466 RepID=UPI00382ACA14